MLGGGKHSTSLLVLLILASFIVLPTPTHSITNYDWVQLNITTQPNSIALYDYDGDGYKEVITNIGIIEGTTVITSPYIGQHVALIDLDEDGAPELVSWGDGVLHVYKGTTEIWNTTIPNTPTFTVYRYALVISDTVVWNLTKIILPKTGYLLATPAQLILIYTENNTLYAENLLTGTTYTIYQDDFTPLGALIDYQNLYIVAISPTGTLAYIIYHLYNETPEILIHTLIPQELVAVDYYHGYFYIKADNMLYKVSKDGVLLVSSWEPKWVDPTYIYLYNQEENKLAVYSIPEEAIKATITLPEEEKAPIIVGAYPSITLIYDNATYIRLYQPKPLLYVATPTSLIAGENSTIQIVAYYATDIIVLLDGIPIAKNMTYVTLSITEPGAHTLTIQASNKYATTTITRTIYVSPRPLAISFQLIEQPTIQAPGKILIKTKDTLQEEYITTTCQITTPYQTTTFPSNTITNLYIPQNITDLTIPITITCGEPPYETITKTYNIVAQRIPTNITISYLGNGTIHIEAYSITGQLLNGSIRLVIGGQTIVRQAPANITLEPGIYNATIVFTPSLSLYSGITLKTTITMLGPVENLSEVNLSMYKTVLIADKVINNTIYVEKPITKTQIKTIYRLDTRYAVIVAGAGLLGGIILGLLITKLKKKDIMETTEV